MKPNHVYSLLPPLLCLPPIALLAALSVDATPPDYATSLSTCCPFGLTTALINHLVGLHLFPAIDASSSPTKFIVQSCLTKTPATSRPIPSTSDWTAAYRLDPDTKILLDHLSTSSQFLCSKISSVHSAYRDYIRIVLPSLSTRLLSSSPCKITPSF
jgi:hypothetical protein